MSQDCSVAVLNDCTEINISKISVKDIGHHRPSQVSIENESILSNGTDISASQVLRSKSFLERVQSMDIAELFPRGSLNQKRKKKKKNTNISTASVSTSSESTSSFNKTDNTEEKDVNLSVSTVICSVADSFELIPEKKKIINEDKSLRRKANSAFNKKLYLKKKSVNVSFDSVKSEKSSREITPAVKRPKNKAVNVSFDSESLTNTSNSASPSSLVGSSDKKLTVEEQPDGHFLSQKLDKENASRILTRNQKKRNIPNQISVDLDSPVQFKETNELKGSLRKLKTKNKLQKRVSVHFDFDSSQQSCDETFDKIKNKNIDMKFIDNNKTDIENMSMELDSRIENGILEEKKMKLNADVTTMSNTSMELVSRIEFMSGDDKEAPSDKAANEFNKNLTLKKNPLNATFDLAANEISMSEHNVLNSPIKKADEIKSNNISVSSREETSTNQGKTFNKKMYLKKKSINVTFTLDDSEMSCTDENVKAYAKATNETDYSKKECSVNEIDQENIENGHINKALSEIGIQEQIVESIVVEDNHSKVDDIEVSQKMNIIEPDPTQPKSANISSNLSPVQLKNANECMPISNEESTMMESISDTKNNVTRAEKNNVFNKQLYLKKKSVSVSFTLGDSEMSCTDENACVQSSNGPDYIKKDSSVKEIDHENIEKGEMNKSVSEIGTQEQTVESMVVEDNHSKVNDIEVSQKMNIIEPDPTQPKSANISSNLSTVQLKNANECMPISNEESTMMESISDTKNNITRAERDNVFNKELYLKKKSVSVLFTLGDSEMSCTDENVNACVQTSNEPDYIKKDSSVKEINHENIENGEMNKSVSESAIQEEQEEIVVEGDHSKVNDKEVSQEMNIIEPDPTQPKSANISSNLSPVELKKANECMPSSNEESTMIESISDTKNNVSRAEMNKVFNKKLYLKKKSVSVSFTLGDSEMSCTDENVNACVQTSNEPDYSKKDSSVKEINHENIEKGEMNKSVSESGIQEEQEEIVVEGDHSKVNDKEVSQEMNIIEPDPTQPKSANVSSNLSPVQLKNANECMPISNEESTMMESISDTKNNVTRAERDNVFNKELYLKKKSVSVSFTLGDSEMSCTDENACVQTFNEPDYIKKDSSVKEIDHEKIENGELNKSGTVEQIGESIVVEGDHSKLNDKEISQDMNIIEKKKSVCISSNSIKSKHLTNETTQTVTNQVTNACNDSLSSERINFSDQLGLIMRNGISYSDLTLPDGSFDIEKHSTDPSQFENSGIKHVRRSSRISNKSNKSVDLASAQLQESDNLRQSRRNSENNNKFSKNTSVHLEEKSFDKSPNAVTNVNSIKTTTDNNNILTQLNSRFENDMQSDKKKELNTNVSLINLSNTSMPDEKDSIKSQNSIHSLNLEIDLDEDGSLELGVNELKEKMDSQETVHGTIRKSVDNCFNNTAIANSMSSCIVTRSSESEGTTFPKSINKTCDSLTSSVLQVKNNFYKEKVTATSHQNNLEEPLVLLIESKNPGNDVVDSCEESISETDQNGNVHVDMETLDVINSNEIEYSVNLFDQDNSKNNRLVSSGNTHDNIAAKVMGKDLQPAGETSSQQINIIDNCIPISNEEYQGHTNNIVTNVSKETKITNIGPLSETEMPNEGNASTGLQSVIETDVATQNVNKSGDNGSSRGKINKNKSLKATKMSLTENCRSTVSAKRNKRRSVTFATTARMKTDSQSGEIELNPSVSDRNDNLSSLDAEVEKRSETVMNTQMSIGISIIRKENENLSDSPKIKKLCHSTPLAKHQKEKNVDDINLIADENSEQKHIFACPDIPARNLRERSYNKSLQISKKNKRDTDNDLDTSENLSKKNRISYYCGNASNESINDISIIPNMNNRTQKKIYHSTPICNTNAKRRKSNERSKKSISGSDEQVQQNDKMIQVSKTIFGSSTEGTCISISKKKSLGSNASNKEEEESTKMSNKRKSDGDCSVSKKAKEMDSSPEERSYHSNFVSTFESESSYYTTKTPSVNQKKVTFKNISTSGNVSTTDYRSSTSESSYYITRNSKKVGFREAISLINETTGDCIRDVNNSDFSIELVAKDLSNDQSNQEKELSNMVERPSATLNYTAEEPEIIIEENEIGENTELSTECSLFKKVKAMSKSNKRDKKTGTKTNEVTKMRQKNVKISNYEAGPHDKWVSKKLITFLNDKLFDDNLDHIVNTERIVSILCSAVSAVKHLKNVDDIDSALLPLKNILVKFYVCSNMIEYCTFISTFTPFEFQRKALFLGGYFGSVERHSDAKLTDPIV